MPTPEYIPESHIPLFIAGQRLYSGTTVENFLACSSLNGDGTVIFDKTKVPFTHQDQVFYLIDHEATRERTFGIALHIASKLGHQPLVISTLALLENVRYDVGEIVVLHNPVIVDQVLTLRKDLRGLDFDNINPYSKPDPFDVFDSGLVLAWGANPVSSK